MASAADPPATTAQSNTPAVSASRTESAQEVSSTTPVEMETLAPPGAASSTTDTTAQASDPATATATGPATIAVPHTTATIPATESQAAAAKAALPSNLTRTETEAIGPSIDTLAAQPDHTDGPVLVITLLLTSGARHPYRIDERYLKRRNVTVDEMNPYNITVYTLKELIWRDWRSGTFAHRYAHQAHTDWVLRMGAAAHKSLLNTPDIIWSHAGRQGPA